MGWAWKGALTAPSLHQEAGVYIRVLSAVKPKEGASKGSLSQRVWTLSEGGRGKPAVMDRK